MVVKLFEIRDRATCISALAIRLGAEDEAGRWLLSRAGFETPSEYVLLMNLDGGHGEYSSDPYAWETRARTMPAAHRYVIEHFDELTSGAVVDVEYILGERRMPKETDRRAWA